MKKNIKDTGLHLTEESRGYLERKIVHLEKYVRDGESSSIDVEVAYDSGLPEKKFRTGIHLVADGKNMHAHARGDTLHEAIDRATQELSIEASRAKGKRLHAFRKGALRIKDFFRGTRNSI